MKQCPQCNFSSEDTDIVCKNCGYLFSAQNFSSPTDGGASQQPLQPPQPPIQQPYQQDQNYPAPGYPDVQVVPNSNKNNGLAIAGFILGLVGTLFSWCYGFGLLPGIPGLILSIVSINQINKSRQNGKGFAIAGVVLSVLAIIASILFIIFFIYIFTSPTYKNLINEYTSQSVS
jgi:hypothetical protein